MKPRAKRLTKSSEHYVDNKTFTAAVTEYVLKYRVAKANNTQLPRISNYVGECILKIANHLSMKPNFSGYTSREDMIGDGVENCVMYLHNFNPDKSPNAFAYVTQIIFFAFLRRIQKEKKQRYIKHKMVERTAIFEILQEEGIAAHDIDVDFRPSIEEYLKQNSEDFSCFTTKKPGKEVTNESGGTQ